MVGSHLLVNVFPRSLMLVLEREWLELPIATEVQDELRLGNQCCESHPRKQLDLSHAASVQSHVETEQSTLLNREANTCIMLAALSIQP